MKQFIGEDVVVFGVFDSEDVLFIY